VALSYPLGVLQACYPPVRTKLVHGDYAATVRKVNNRHRDPKLLPSGAALRQIHKRRLSLLPSVQLGSELRGLSAIASGGFIAAADDDPADGQRRPR
jgi:hypothetical protein